MTTQDKINWLHVGGSLVVALCIAIMLDTQQKLRQRIERLTLTQAAMIRVDEGVVRVAEALVSDCERFDPHAAYWDLRERQHDFQTFQLEQISGAGR